MEKTTTVYFSHPVTHYDTYLEDNCIQTIISMITPVDIDEEEYFFELVNPNQQWIQNLYLKRKENGHKNPFEIFKEMAIACDVIIGATFLDGAIGHGVSEEMEAGLKNNKEVYLILFNDGKKLFLPYLGSSVYNVLSIEETRKRVRNGDI